MCAASFGRSPRRCIGGEQLLACPFQKIAAGTADGAADNGKPGAGFGSFNVKLKSLPAGCEKRAAGIAERTAGTGKCAAGAGLLNVGINSLPAGLEIGLPESAEGLPDWEMTLPEMKVCLRGSKHRLPESPNELPETEVELPGVKVVLREPNYRGWETKVGLPG